MKTKNFTKLLAIVFLFGSHWLMGQQTITINPTRDTYVSDFLDTYAPTVTVGGQAGMEASTWTHGNTCNCNTYFKERMLLGFDLSSIPSCATITSAVIKLSGTTTPGFILQAGNNSATLSPMTANWSENSTWTSLGSGTGFNLTDADIATIPASTSLTQIFNVTVTGLVKRMVQGLLANNGFAISLVNESSLLRRSLTLGTRENSDPNLRPVLTITYLTTPTASPAFVTAPSTTVCAGSSVNYSVNPIGNGLTYVWKKDGVVINTSNLPTYNKTWTPAELGNHTISALAMNACGTTSALNFALNVSTAPSQPSSIIGTSTICANAFSYYSVSNPTAPLYQWYVNGTLVAGQTTSIAQLSFPNGGLNTISVVGVSVDGVCKSTSTAKSVQASTPPTGIVINGPTVICPSYSGAYTVVPSSPNGYTWKIVKNLASNPVAPLYLNPDNNGATVPFPYSPGSIYTIVVAANNSCGNVEVSLPVTLRNNVAPAPSITCTNKVNGVCKQLGATSNANVTSIVWNIDGTNRANLNNLTTVDLTQAANQGVNYRVTFSDANCSYYGYFGECKNVIQGQPATRMAEEIELPKVNAYQIYPNPSTGIVTIETKGQIGKAYVFNTLGQVVTEVDLNSSETVYSVNLPSKGLYTFKIKSEGETLGYKLVVE